MAKRSTLSKRQLRFVDEYLVDLNASAAALRAGYSAKTAGAQGSRLLKHVEIKALVEKRRAQLQEETRVTQRRVIEELAKVGFSEIRNVMTWNEESAQFIPSDVIEDEQAGAIQSVKSRTRTTSTEDGAEYTTHEMEIRMYDKVSALTKIGQHLGMFAKRQVNYNVDVDLTEATDEQLERIKAGEDPIKVMGLVNGSA